MAEDQVYLFRALESVESIIDTSENFYTYQIHNSDQLTNSKKKLNDMFEAFKYLLDDYSSNVNNKSSSFETITARMILTSRLHKPLLIKMIYKFISTRQIPILVKIKILEKTLNQFFLRLRSR
jgi:hypothetical protein